jgi:hypothetical protein
MGWVCIWSLLFKKTKRVSYSFNTVKTFSSFCSLPNGALRRSLRPSSWCLSSPLLLSLPIRRSPGGGILMEGGRSRSHRTESTRDGDTRFTQFRNTCSRIGPIVACLKLSGHFCVVTMSYGCTTRVPRIRFIKALGSRVSTESPNRITI